MKARTPPPSGQEFSLPGGRHARPPGPIVTTRDGRVFTRLGSTPYQRKDGAQVELHIWQGRCVLCGQTYQIRATARPSRKSLAIVTCPDHRGMVRRRAKV